jgi:cation transporter-like permease
MLVATYSSIKGLDPDNVTIPVIAMLGDVIGISCLFLVAIALGGLM